MKHEVTAKRIREALSDAKLKPQELAEKSKVSKSSISQYVNGSHQPSNISSGKMAKVLGVEPMWLMGFDVPKKKVLTPEVAKDDFRFLEKFSLLEERDKKIDYGYDRINAFEKNREVGHPHFSAKSFIKVCR